MKSIDKAILGMVSESSDCNESESIGDHRKRPQGPSCRVDGEGNMDRRKLTEATIHPGGALATAR
jgi:hypothetical protein